VFGNEIWLGGQGGTVMRRTGTTWSRLDTRTDRWIRRIVPIAANDVWAWGDGATFRESTVLHWNGRTWEPRAQGLTHEIDALGGTPNAVYATGEFGLARWTGSAWTIEIPTTALGAGYHSLDDICATDRQIIVSDRGGHALIRAR
jgi:hypothetical protein